MRALMFSFVAVVLLTPAEARAEYRHVELKIFGMDCATCAHGLRVQIQKIDGVESVELSLQRAAADIRLKPDNRVALDQFRQVVKGNGFAAREARVTAIGRVRAVGGKLAFEVSGVGGALLVDAANTTAEANRMLRTAHESKKDAALEVTGTVQKGTDGAESLAVASVKPVQ
jgi:copper chaperone CopZ